MHTADTYFFYYNYTKLLGRIIIIINKIVFFYSCFIRETKIFVLSGYSKYKTNEFKFNYSVIIKIFTYYRMGPVLLIAL